jgi:hypothetical protein
MAERKSAPKSRGSKKIESPYQDELRGWAQIAMFLGQPLAVAQRWAHSGMPISHKGRYTIASKQELSRWLGRESGVNTPVHLASDSADLTSDLKRGLSYVRATGKKTR